MAENHFTSQRALWWPESGPGRGCVTPTSSGGWASRGIASPSLRAPALLIPRCHLLLEPSAPAHLNSGVKGGTRTWSFPRCNSVALPRNWNQGFTQADPARSSHPPESLARGSVHSGWARGRGWGMLGPFLKPRSMNSR